MAQSVSQGRGAPARRGNPAAARRRRYRRSRWGIWLVPVLVVGLLALGAVSAIAAYEFTYVDRVYPGVQVAGIPMDGMTLDEATAAIEEGLTPYPGLPVVLQYENRRWALAPADLGLAVDAPATAAQAYAVGRTGTSRASSDESQGVQAYWQGQWEAMREDLLDQWSAVRQGRALRPVLQFNEGEVASRLERIAREVDVAPVEGSLAITGLDVIPAAGRPGRQVNVDATRAALIEAARAGKGGNVPLVAEERLPVVASVDEAAARARALLSRPLTLVTQGAETGQRFAVDRATLRQWLQIAPVSRPDGTVELRVQVDRSQIDAYLKQIAGQFDRPAQDATLDFDPSTRQIKVVTASRPGQQLDTAAGAQAIEDALTGDQREIAVPSTVLQPKVDMNKVSEMGITELVTEATTGFAGSSAGRVKNIANAASKFNNVVIPPGDVFSFNRYVGDITSANGFVDSLIIAGDRTEVGVGGGVCQVSTTVFQAAARGGFPIVERWNHSYVVGYYGKPGLDATIFTPSVDFRFKNDSGHYLLIKTDVNVPKKQVTFRFYGTKPDRTVEISDPQITNLTPPDKPVYREDKSLPEGTIKQVDWAVTGQDVVVTRTIRNGDGTVKQDKFVSKYQPWRSIFLYGPGTDLPAGAGDPGSNG